MPLGRCLDVAIFLTPQLVGFVEAPDCAILSLTIKQQINKGNAMDWKFIITHELLWLGLALIALAVGLGILEFFINLFGDDEDE